MDYLVVELKTHVIIKLFRVVWFSQWAVYTGFWGSKPGVSFSFARPKENETKEKGAGNKAHFPRKTRYPAPIGRLLTGLKCAALFLDVSPPYSTKIFNDAPFIIFMLPGVVLASKLGEF